MTYRQTCFSQKIRKIYAEKMCDATMSTNYHKLFLKKFYVSKLLI